MKKGYLYLLIVVVILVIGVIFGFKAAGVFGIIGIGAGLGTKKAKKESDQVMDQAQEEKKETENIKNNIEDREKRDKKLSKKLNKHFHMLLIIIMMVAFSGIGLTQDKPPNIDNLKMPDTYEEAVAFYKDMAMIAIEYQQLYREAEAGNKQLAQSNDNLLQLIEAQKEIIDKLLKSNSNAGVIAGVNVTPGNIENTGLILGLNYQF